MDRHLIEIDKILKEETTRYIKVHQLEVDKSSAIMEHNGKLLESISLEQERLLAGIAALDLERLNYIAQYKKHKNIKKEKMSLSELMGFMDKAESVRLAISGENLKKIVHKLNIVLRTNRVLINDNMEFYNILLTGLRKGTGIKTGYDCDGKEEDTIKNPILFNQTA